MPNPPENIDRSVLLAALHSAGIDTDNLAELRADARNVELTYFATNSDGRKFLIEGVPAQVSHTVKVVGQWRPDPA